VFYINGDMFGSNQIPFADAYIMKMILHDWSDAECARILSNIYASFPEHARLFIAEHLVSGPNQHTFQKSSIYI
jgi:O-methyltransferase domain